MTGWVSIWAATMGARLRRPGGFELAAGLCGKRFRERRRASKTLV
jgi:hypothetical protein